jgi:hypothetical protein
MDTREQQVRAPGISSEEKYNFSVLLLLLQSGYDPICALGGGGKRSRSAACRAAKLVATCASYARIVTTLDHRGSVICVSSEVHASNVDVGSLLLLLKAADAGDTFMSLASNLELLQDYVTLLDEEGEAMGIARLTFSRSLG